MKTKLFNALKQDHKNLGLSEDVLQAYADSLAATGLVTDENLATISKGQETALKVFQSNLDKERTSKTALQKTLDDYKAAHPEKGGDPDKKDEPKFLTKEDIKAAVAEFMTPFSEKLTTFETQTKAEKRQADVSAKAKEYGIPETFVSKFAIKDDADLDDYFKGVKQEFVNIGYEGTTPPEIGSQPNKDSNALADMIDKGTKEIVESKK